MLTSLLIVSFISMFLFLFFIIVYGYIIFSKRSITKSDINFLRNTLFFITIILLFYRNSPYLKNFYVITGYLLIGILIIKYFEFENITIEKRKNIIIKTNRNGLHIISVNHANDYHNKYK